MVFQSKGINETGLNQKTHHQMIAAFDTLGNGIILNEKDEIRSTKISHIIIYSYL